MARNIDDFVTQPEHAFIDHTGLPGVGGGTTIVGAEVIETDANIAGNPMVKTIPANTLTADLQTLEVKYAFDTGTGATPNLDITFGGQTILPTTTAAGANLEGALTIWVVRTGATSARVTIWNTSDALATQDAVTSSITLDWSIARDFSFLFSGGTGESHHFYQALKWPEAGASGISGIGSDTLPLGTIVPYGGPIIGVPVGFLPCDGSTVSQTTYSDLFSVIGTSWNTGGEPGGDFRLPDFRGRSFLGLNDGTLPNGANGGLTTRTLGAFGGSETHTLTGAETGPHTHAITDPGHTHAQQNANQNPNPPNLQTYPSDTGDQAQTAGNTASATTGITVDSGGGGSPHNNVHPFATCAAIIKAQQVGGGLGVSAQQNGGVLQGPQPTLNFIPSGVAGVTVVENIGQNRIDITISATGASNTTYETGNAFIGSIPASPGTYNVSGSWPGGFSPRGMIFCCGSTAETFLSIGFTRANTGGVATSASISFTASGTIGTAANLASFGGSTIAPATPLSNSWDVVRTGAAASAWSEANMVLGDGP